MIGDAALAAGARLGFELVDEVNDIEEAAAGAAADAGPCDGDGGVIVYRERKAFCDVMRLSGCGSRDGTRGRFRGRCIAQQ